MGPVYVWGAMGDGFVLCVECADKRDPDWQRTGSGLYPLIYPNETQYDQDVQLYCDACETTDFRPAW